MVRFKKHEDAPGRALEIWKGGSRVGAIWFKGRYKNKVITTDLTGLPAVTLTASELRHIADMLDKIEKGSSRQ